MSAVKALMLSTYAVPFKSPYVIASKSDSAAEHVAPNESIGGAKDAYGP